MRKIVFILFITVSLVSCLKQKSLSKDDVLSIMDGYFEKTKQSNFNLVESYYSEEIYKNTSKEKWEELYNKIHLILGSLVSVELESCNVRSEVSTSRSGKYFILIYNNKYENGNAKETINLFQPKGSIEIKIIGHNYNSESFLEFK